MLLKKLIIITLGLIMFISLSSCSKKKLYTEVEETIDDMSEVSSVKEPEIRNKKFEEAFYLDKIYFDYDASTLSESARQSVQKNSDWLMQNKNCIIVLEGHCDERGTTEYNLALGQKRATVIREYLSYLGVEAGRIATISYGEEKPADFSYNEKSWSLNRRVEFKCSFDEGKS